MMQLEIDLFVVCAMIQYNNFGQHVKNSNSNGSIYQRQRISITKICTSSSSCQNVHN